MALLIITHRKKLPRNTFYTNSRPLLSPDALKEMVMSNVLPRNPIGGTKYAELNCSVMAWFSKVFCISDSDYASMLGVHRSSPGRWFTKKTKCLHSFLNLAARMISIENSIPLTTYIPISPIDYYLGINSFLSRTLRSRNAYNDYQPMTHMKANNEQAHSLNNSNRIIPTLSIDCLRLISPFLFINMLIDYIRSIGGHILSHIYYDDSDYECLNYRDPDATLHGTGIVGRYGKYIIEFKGAGTISNFTKDIITNCFRDSRFKFSFSQVHTALDYQYPMEMLIPLCITNRKIIRFTDSDNVSLGTKKSYSHAYVYNKYQAPNYSVESYKGLGITDWKYCTRIEGRQKYPRRMKVCGKAIVTERTVGRLIGSSPNPFINTRYIDPRSLNVDSPLSFLVILSMFWSLYEVQKSLKEHGLDGIAEDLENEVNRLADDTNEKYIKSPFKAFEDSREILQHKLDYIFGIGDDERRVHRDMQYLEEDSII